MARTPDAARRSETSRQAVLAATAAICAESGYQRLTIEAIAARAGVGKMTIYRWWPSKGAIVLDLLDQAAAVGIDPPDTGDLAADLRSLLVEVIDILTPLDSSPAIGLLAESLHDCALSRQVHERLIRPRIATFEQRLRRAQEVGQLPPDVDLAVALDLLYGPIYHRLAVHLDMPDDDHLDALVAHTLRALGASDTAAPPSSKDPAAPA
ncbi:TetR/AcrR family transcriptional regulator [Luteimicrobium sp. NPDC057192]|uniref:TetR/AcrR family transcriptional regulator n=1 Tax=Luteimicrobium sp. NPDC057192 TaxID=3346042 RepID=UPI00363EC8D9